MLAHLRAFFLHWPELAVLEGLADCCADTTALSLRLLLILCEGAVVWAACLLWHWQVWWAMAQAPVPAVLGVWDPLWCLSYYLEIGILLTFIFIYFHLFSFL